MSQPVPTYTQADLERVIARDYTPEAIPRVRALLDSYGRESWQPEILRVQMACLKVAGGDLSALEQHVRIACSDYRDVLAAAEYPRYMRAQTTEAKHAAIEADWRELQSWLHRE